MFYFYVLKSTKDSNYYYGSTDDLKRRIMQHQSGSVGSTECRLPLSLIYYEAYQTLGLARQRERQVKSSGSIRKALNKRIALDEGPARPPVGKPGQ